MGLRLIILLILLSSIAIAQRHHIAVQFSEPVYIAGALDKDNYTIWDAELNEIPILNVWQANDSVFVVVVDFLDYKSNYSVRVENVSDLAGNLINVENNSAWFYFDGFDLDELQPYLIVGRGTYLITNYLRHPGGGWFKYNIWWTRDTLYMEGIDTTAYYKFAKNK